LPGESGNVSWLDYPARSLFPPDDVDPANGAVRGALDVSIGGPGLNTLIDNYFTVRYKPLSPNHPLYTSDPNTGWSTWTLPGLAEGWIKRVSRIRPALWTRL
jgi:hypothetical protein